MGKFWLEKLLPRPSHKLLRTHGPKLCTLFHCPLILQLYDVGDEGNRTFTSTIYERGMNICLKIKLVLTTKNFHLPTNSIHWARIYIEEMLLLKKLLNTTVLNCFLTLRTITTQLFSVLTQLFSVLHTKECVPFKEKGKNNIDFQCTLA